MNTLMKRNGNTVIPNLFEEFPGKGFFDFLEDMSIGRASNNLSMPRVNIMETGTDYKVEMAVPGMKKEDFKVEIDNGSLIIQAEKNSEQERNSNGNCIRREFSYSAFRRSFDLPNTVESEKIEATYVDGILKLIIPKREEARQKPVRTIEIS
ncbi:Hsp20/alpha crystallin family protein [Algoriphagus halophytocola]|uniref:Hsp20/alpha crystallin family protein n=1 Tax=Algoriphagus halophytocola TaxID=2991499 RepID=A0ABY6MLM2_9BACT|nr:MULTISPECIES: Hsp20/alpha crystallin family protein [unclassified Algoriphagus]UZD23094.1 Hsp20/alpha crystallin family protein [Algoriphagus sp. TR-M5]WBL44386.1 Hsp20/alpha crystallin family protein [Algoriphagus sp. TR-M9]